MNVLAAYSLRPRYARSTLSGPTLAQVMAFFPDGSKLLPESMLTYRQYGPMGFI